LIFPFTLLHLFRAVPVLLIQSETGLVAYHIGSDSISTVMRFDGYEGDRPFAMLQVYLEPPPGKEPLSGSTAGLAYVIGICEDADVLIWTVEIEGGSRRSNRPGSR
jgi:hypothetical protein